MISRRSAHIRQNAFFFASWKQNVSIFLKKYFDLGKKTVYTIQ